MKFGKIAALAGLGAGLGLGVPAAATILGLGSPMTDIGNLGMQIANYRYQKDLQKEVFRREDTSIQRRVNDLKAAGLSPILAAGSGADSGTIIQTHAPQFENSLPKSAELIMSMIQMQKDFAVKDQQIQNLQAERDKINIETLIKNHDYKIFKETNTTSNSGGFVNNMRNLLGFSDSPVVKNAAKVINDKIDDTLHTPKRSDYNIKEYDNKIRKMTKKEKEAEWKRLDEQNKKYYEEMKKGK